MASIKVQARNWAARITPKTWVWKDTYSVGNIHHLNTLLDEIIPKKKLSEYPLYGLHFLFNTQSNTQLGLDGYDNYQAPMDETHHQLYARRMWVGGTLEYMQRPPKAGDNILCSEKVQSVRCLGSNAFVNISRTFSNGETVVMKEIRTLLYTNEPYGEPQNKTLSQAKKYTNSAPVKVTLLQLMRFNALSYNLHKIHYDRAYCQQENLKNVVVSGPFLVLAMLRFFGAQYPEIQIKHFKYKNSEPCFIDEELNLGIEQTSEGYVVEFTKDGNLRCGGLITV